ncbi:hypothetical protein [Vibrio aestuarianus]|uniref:Uncharacterized protein n=1 Tax=Vibrio aestuarianus TaxID=28171 RepID=A0A9X4ETA9_9VIBR|nr:hypothetical protein [Vibrio aestuarianus]MDE1241112.1 hypothetical protein [Vibrio aestuarianus]
MQIFDSPKSGYQPLEADSFEKELQFALSDEIDDDQCLPADGDKFITEEPFIELNLKQQPPTEGLALLGFTPNMMLGSVPLRGSKSKRRGIEEKMSVVTPLRSSTISSQTTIGKEFNLLSSKLLEYKGVFTNDKAETAVFIGSGKTENSAFIGKMLPSISNHYNIAPAPAAINSLANISLQLTPSIFWHYPALNSYRVFFRQKYYLFRFEGNQVTNYLEEDHDRS